jgi:hypothetical protein
MSDTRQASPLHPRPATAGRCPRCERALDVRRLRLPGWRILVDGDCGGCGHRYLQDLPSGHGLVYPATLDLDTGETIDPAGAVWFADALRRIWEEPDPGPVRFEAEIRRETREATLLDCLDPVWGHSLLKLLNVQRELRSGRDVIALVPSSLRHLVPDGVAEVWTVDEPSRRLGEWLVELERRLARELERFDSCGLSPAFPHPHPSTYDLDALVVPFPPERIAEPQIVLCLRDDRLWGADADAEGANLARLRDRVAATHPGAAIVAIGVGGATPLPGDVTDLRSAAPDSGTERRWIALLRAADVAIGVHGSHLLLPSGLAQVIVELAPRGRWGNVLQATLPGRDPVLALARQRVLYGGDDLADLDADHVADIALAALGERPRIERLMTGAAAGVGEGPVERISASPPLPKSGEPGSPPRPQPLRAARRVAATARERGRDRLQERSVQRRAQAQDLPAVLEDGHGIRYELTSAEEVERFVRDGGPPGTSAAELAARTLEPGMTAFDVGAGIGALTTAMARAVAPDGRVHAFEPSPDRLERTLALNDVGNVVVNGGETGATSLDDYCDRHGIERVDTIRVSAANVLAELPGMLEGGAIDLALVDLSGDRTHEVVDVLERAGLSTFCADGDRVRPFRPAGPLEQPVTLVACTERGLERLREMR